MKKLKDTWLILICGQQKFAINSAYVETMQDFNNAECIKAVTQYGVYRGTFKIGNNHLILIDGRKILGEETVTEIINKFERKIGQLNLDILELQSKIQLYLITNHTKLDIQKQYEDIINNLTDFLNSISDKESKNKYRLNRSIIELDFLYKKIVEKIQKESIDNAWNTYRQLEYSITKLNSDFDRIKKDYINSFNEQIIVTKYKENIYGLVVDKIDIVSKEIELLKPNDECYKYKAIAGRCKYQEKEYYVFNIKYLTELAKKFD